MKNSQIQPHRLGVQAKVHFFFCEKCLLSCVERLWPTDVGVSLEAEGNVIHFLHVRITVDDHGSFQVAPFSNQRKSVVTLHSVGGLITDFIETGFSIIVSS